MSNTSEEYNSIVKICTDIFTKKMKDYGSAWRILRTSSLTDQIFIKAKRIRSIEEKGFSKVDEGIRSEYIAIANYCVMALIQLELGESSENTEIPFDECIALYDKHFFASKKLMEDKNHDYDEVL